MRVETASPADRLITIGCWTGIVFFGIAALGGFASQGASGGFLMLSFAGFCAFFLLRRKENRARSAPAFAPQTNSAFTPDYQTWPGQAYVPQTANYTMPQPVPLQLPSRVTKKWLAANAPRIHPAQVPMFLDELRSRGWTEARIQQKVLPLLRG